MRRKHSKPMTINHFIMNAVKEKQTDTVEQLVQLVQRKFSISKEEVMKHIIDLNNNGKLAFKELSFPSARKSYLLSIKAVWYWTILVLAIATSITVFTIPENVFPLVYARYVLGSIFVLFLPGYSLIKALFPTKELDNIERSVLSIVMSITLVPITALLLNYTPWGIKTTPVTLSLLALTIVFATTAIIREHKAKLEEHQRKAGNPKLHMIS